MAVLIAYATIEGQTGKIARFLEDVVGGLGEEVRLLDTSDASDTVDINGFDQVILAAPVHERRHPSTFEAYLTANQDAIARKRTMLLSVSLSAAFPEGAEEAQDYADEMKMRTELDPDAEMLVAGAVRKRKYDYYATQVLKHVVLRGRNYDPAVQEHEFTDWDALAAGVTAFVEGGA